MQYSVYDGVKTFLINVWWCKSSGHNTIWCSWVEILLLSGTTTFS